MKDWKWDWGQKREGTSKDTERNALPDQNWCNLTLAPSGWLTYKADSHSWSARKVFLETPRPHWDCLPAEVGEFICSGSWLTASPSSSWIPPYTCSLSQMSFPWPLYPKVPGQHSKAVQSQLSFSHVTHIQFTEKTHVSFPVPPSRQEALARASYF